MLLHGFSRGSANIYGVAALDRKTGNDFFSLVVANAGGAAEDFPFNRDIDRGRLGKSPFARTRWVLFCGGKDPHPDRDGCPGMSRTKKWIEGKGGSVALFIQDPSSGHGGFHLNKANVAKALDLFIASGEK